MLKTEGSKQHFSLLEVPRVTERARLRVNPCPPLCVLTFFSVLKFQPAL